MKYYHLPLLIALQATTALAIECHPEPILPPPRNLARSPAVQEALATLSATLDGAIRGDIRAGWDTNNVSLSIGLVSIGQDDPSIPLWEYHHLAAGNVEGTTLLDRNSQYLIGSVSKVLVDAVLLKSGVEMHTPILELLPALGGSEDEEEESLIDWGEITLGDLAGQMAGIPVNCKFLT
jgi:hypothetical protein